MPKRKAPPAPKFRTLGAPQNFEDGAYTIRVSSIGFLKRFPGKIFTVEKVDCAGEKHTIAHYDCRGSTESDIEFSTDAELYDLLKKAEVSDGVASEIVQYLRTLVEVDMAKNPISDTVKTGVDVGCIQR